MEAEIHSKYNQPSFLCVDEIRNELLGLPPVPKRQRVHTPLINAFITAHGIKGGKHVVQGFVKNVSRNKQHIWIKLEGLDDYLRTLHIGKSKELTLPSGAESYYEVSMPVSDSDTRIRLSIVDENDRKLPATGYEDAGGPEFGGVVRTLTE